VSEARRIRSVWLLAIVAVVGVLVLVAVVTSGSAPPPSTTPEAVAGDWMTALLRGQDAERHALECPGSVEAQQVGLLVVDAASVRTQPARRIRSDRWVVTVNLFGPKGALLNAVPLTVDRIDGVLKVC
jgi:hypothetical protein